VLAEGFAGTPIREVFSRPKQGFSVPASEWLAGPLASPLLDLVNSSRVRDSGLVKAQAVEALLRRHQSRREDASQKLWGVLSLALWLRHWG
jgi:asparagine synthase (glutamine-hydrolysing)